MSFHLYRKETENCPLSPFIFHFQKISRKIPYFLTFARAAAVHHWPPLSCICSRSSSSLATFVLHLLAQQLIDDRSSFSHVSQAGSGSVVFRCPRFRLVSGFCLYSGQELSADDRTVDRRVVPVRAARRSLCRRLLSCDPCLRRMNRQGARRSPGRARSGHRMRTLLPARSYILPGTEPWLFLHGPFVYPSYEIYRAPSDMNRTKNGCSPFWHFRACSTSDLADSQTWM